MRTDLTDDEHWYLIYVDFHSDQGRKFIGWVSSFHKSVDALVERGLIEKTEDKNSVWIKSTPDGVLLARLYGEP
jgi:hypothetical protein